MAALCNVCGNHSFSAAKLDYDVVTDPPVTLTSEYPNATISISIVNDNLPETAESFEINLIFSGRPSSLLTLNPSTARVMILDDDDAGEFWLN